MSQEARNPLVVALDLPTARQALDIAGRLAGHVAYVKVGLELYVAEGPVVVSSLRDMGHKVFLDLKLCDIPNTVSRAVAAARRLGASFLTVHAGGGRAMLRAAAVALGPTAGGAGGSAVESVRGLPGEGLALLAVTVLTSLDQRDLAATGIAGRLRDQVLRLASLAAECGIHGVVASAREAAQLRKSHPRPFLIATPGVRPAWNSGMQDQARVASPAEAVRAGADLVIVGRPITTAPDPAEAASRIAAELDKALEEGEEG